MNPFNPGFLKRMDKFLLQHHPLIWVTRIHYVFLYAVYVFALSFLLGLVFPINIVEPNSLGVYYLLFILVAITLYVLWIYRNSIFNIENRFGNRSIWDEYKLFFIYFFTISLICTNYIPFQVVNQYKMANAISDEDYVRELNILNLGDAFFVTTYSDYEESYDTLHEHTYYDYSQYKHWNRFTPSYYGGYGIFGGGYYDGYNDPNNRLIMEGCWSDSLLAQKFSSLKDRNAKLKVITEYLSVFKKYDREILINPENVLAKYEYYVKLGRTIEMPSAYDDNELDYSQKKYDIERAYNNVAEAKFDKIYYYNSEFYIFLFYLVFYMVLFFMMFRNVRWQQYLITLIAMAIVPLLVVIIFQITRAAFGYYDTGNMIGGTLLFIYFGVFVYSIIFSFAAPKAYSGFASILLQIANICTPVALLFILVYAHEAWDAFKYKMPYELTYFDHYNYTSDDHGINLLKNYPSEVKQVLFHQAMQNWWRACYDRWLIYSQIIGMVFYVFVYMPYLKEQFVKLKALPKRK